MCMCTYLHIWSPSLLVFVYIFTYMHTEFVSGIYVYICANWVYMCLYIYQHIYTRKLHVWGFIFTYIYTKFTDVFTPSLHVCVYVLTYMCVCRCVHLYIYVWKDTVCPRAVCVYKYNYTCLCLYLVYGCVLNVCVDIHVYIYAHRGCGCMYTIYMYCIGVCTCVRIHTEFSCVIFSMFTYFCYHPVEV